MTYPGMKEDRDTLVSFSHRESFNLQTLDIPDMNHIPGYIERLIERTYNPFDPGSLISFLTEQMAM